MDVSGLEISQKFLRAIRLSRSGNNLKIAKIAQLALPEGIISNGKVLDPEKFAGILANFLKANHFSSAHWVVSLNEGAIYTTYKIFPDLPSQELDEAVEINLGSLLPGKASDIFWGWQEVEPISKITGKEVMISSIAKKDLGGYLAAFGKIGIIPIAIEPRSCSMARVFGKAANTLVVNIEGTPSIHIASVVLSNGFARFSREVALEGPSKDQFKMLLSEIRRVMNFYLTEKNDAKIDNLVLDGPGATAEMAASLKKALNFEVKLSSEIFKDLGLSLPSLALLGAGLRALEPPQQDTSLSLLPVGAQEASQEKRALMFYGGLANIIVVTILLFLFCFFGAWGFLKYLSDRADEQLMNLSQGAVTSDSQVSEIQNAAQEINPQIELIAGIEDQISYWSAVLKEINALVPQGVILSQINFSGTADTLNIVGTAQSREALVSFRDSLSGQTFVESVQMPSSNFSESQNINFTITITVKKDALKKK